MKPVLNILILSCIFLSTLAQNFESNSIFPFRPSEERYLQQIAFVHRLRQQLREQLRQANQQPVLQASETEVAPAVALPPTRLRQPFLQQPLPDNEQFQLEEPQFQQNVELLRQEEEEKRELERQRQQEEQERELERQEIQRQLEEQRRQREFEEQERQRVLLEQQRLAAERQRQEQERQRQLEQQRTLERQRIVERQNFSRQFEVRDEGGASIRTVRQEAPMTEVCLACICQASTNCNLATRCVSNGQYCGPFLISKPYWIDAGMPTLVGDNPARSGAFEDCTADPVCSAQSVRAYMTKYAKDCNNDGRIDCDDLGRIHLMGSNGCSNPSTVQTPFFQRFRQCVFKASNLN